jgi:hypothetical protein
MAWLKRKYPGTQKEKDIDVQSKGKLIGVTRQENEEQGKNHYMIRCTKERITVSFS